eukprot:TRINITY_DN25865_c0_g2_i1.p1 TRINITY_DN25865_c0_g2~~TRINITY_DN25865_c0_g2_i1.p1  ORF type:complete len:139 (-),score=15.63 TRINITY_DN25865_c0_g2_i1:402-818(-)
MTQLEDLRQLTSAEQHHLALRNSVDGLYGKAVLPHLGSTLSRLLYLWESMPTTEDGLININKCRSISRLFLEVQEHQRIKFSWNDVDGLKGVGHSLVFFSFFRIDIGEKLISLGSWLSPTCKRVSSSPTRIGTSAPTW